MYEELGLIIKLVFVIVGIGGALYSMYSIGLSLAANSWTPLPGIIEHHVFGKTRDRDGYWMYEANVEYFYEYQGEKYQGNKIGFGYSSWNIKWLIYSAYKEATKNAPSTVVYINPKKPKVSVLLRGLRSFQIANIVFFAFWNVAVCALLISGSV